MYSVVNYFISRNIIEIPFMIIAPFLMAVIMYWMLKLESTAGQFFLFFFILFLITLAGASLGLLIGSIIPDPKLVSTAVPIFILPFVLFGGLYKNRGDYPDWIGWIEYISPNKYSFNALVLNQFQGNPAAQEQLNILDLDLGIWASVGIMIGLSFGLRLLSLFFLSVLRRRL